MPQQNQYKDSKNFSDSLKLKVSPLRAGVKNLNFLPSGSGKKLKLLSSRPGQKTLVYLCPTQKMACNIQLQTTISFNPNSLY